jgi:hypothetical protein
VGLVIFLVRVARRQSQDQTGRVTSYGYHGHDAVLHVQPDRAPDDRTLVVRIIGGPHLPVGFPVTLRARGPVFAWPRD